MNIVLKNNRSMLSNREKFKKSNGRYSSKKTEYNFPKASPQLLRDIRMRIKDERQLKQRKLFVVFTLVLVTSISFLMYLLQ